LRWSLGLPLAAAALAVGAFSVDALVGNNEVVRNAEIARRPVGGLGDVALRNELIDLAADIASLPLTVIAPARGFDATAADWGISLDIEATMAEALDAGRGGVVSSFTDWVTGWLSPHEIAPVLVVNEEVVAATVGELPGAVRRPAIDPSFRAVDGRLEVSEGRDGERLEAASVATALRTAVADGAVPEVVDVLWSRIPARFDEADLEAAIADAQSLVSAPIPVRLNGRSTVIPPETARRWLVSTTETGELRATFDETAARNDLEIRLSALSTSQDPPMFSVVDDEVVVELGAPVMVCCEAPVGALLEAAARGGGIAELSARQRDPDGGQAVVDAYGIGQLVAEFTTNHSCCQSRVANIQRMADLVRGVVIESGATFSINEHVGVRTREKGFVSAGAIERGHLVQDVGGGVSQFATTLFNAAFFAGLDFTDYQSHTIYFSRYPRGREATLGHPAPDLAVTNNTPHAMLIWTDYTDTSITVQLWSTPYFSVEQSGQWSGRWGTACTRVTTERTRVAPDGAEIVDTVFATYRPAEGVDCLGNRIPPP
jgi:vancomycin resistance protein YoaR